MSFCRMVFSGYRPRCGYVDPRLSSLERFVVFFSGIGEAVFSRGCWQCPFATNVSWDHLLTSPILTAGGPVRISILNGGI